MRCGRNFYSLAALNTFKTAALLDARFSLGPGLNWTYTCQGPLTANICVGLEFLGLDGGFLPEVNDPCAFAADSRGEERDTYDLKFLLRR
ncbi:MAG: hypothetical protein M1826_002194 [Phylliscum demangeonii]|nr:MAG: hypothetical protein M1826_002194 [Phylliscum demangeonii]